VSDQTKRISALKALVAGSPELVSTPLCPKIIDELDEVARVRRLEPRRRCRLLQILHSSRALDSALATFLDYHGCRNGRSLGAYLKTLTHLTGLTKRSTVTNSLPQHAAHRYQRNIVDDRNRYMHGSGEYPLNDAEVSDVLAEMQDCLSIVLSL
jgi:hypothetical protein